MSGPEMCRDAVRTYLDVCEDVNSFAADASRSLLVTGYAENFDGLRAMAQEQVAPAANISRLMIVDPRQLVGAYATVYAVLLPKLCGLKPPRHGYYQLPPKLGRYRILKRLESLAAERRATMPFPAKLPFESTFLCYGSRGPRLSRWEKFLRSPGPRPAFESHREARLVGHLLCEAGERPLVAGFAHQWIDGRATAVMLPCYYGGAWAGNSSVDAWVLPAVLDMINDHICVVDERRPTPAERLRRRRLAADGLRLPRPLPYYVVTLRDELITVRARQGTTAALRKAYSFRHDVRAHERCYVERGSLPLGTKHRQSLKRRGYRVYEGRPPSHRDRKRMRKRRLPPKHPWEWIAIRSTWVQQCIRPADPGLPYVPSARRMNTDPEQEQRA